jgi:hypothetical protein
MVMELEAGDASKQSFANHVPGDAQYDCVIRSAGDVFTQGFEAKFGDVNPTQQSARKLCLIDQFFAAFNGRRLCAAVPGHEQRRTPAPKRPARR